MKLWPEEIEKHGDWKYSYDEKIDVWVSNGGVSKREKYIPSKVRFEGTASLSTIEGGYEAREEEEADGGLVAAALFRELAEKEEELSEDAQRALEKMGRGPAAELLGRVRDRGQRD